MRRNFAATKLKPDVRVVFADKDSLKRNKRIALWPVISLAAAACAAVLFLLWDPADSALKVQVNQPVAQNDQKDRSTADDQKNGTDNNTTQSSEPVQVAMLGTQEPSVNTTVSTNAATVRPVRVDRLSIKKADILPENGNDLEIVPATWSKPQPVEQTPAKNEYAMVGFDDMKNPIKPITNRLSDVVKQEVDFRTAKPTEKRSGGFYLKIGKFELSHKKH